MRRILFSLLAALLVPMSAGALPPPVYAADDAGSGADAPRDPARAVPVEPGVIYGGSFQSLWPGVDSLFWDDQDAYSFDAVAGDLIDVNVRGIETVTRLYAPDGAEVAFDFSVAHVEWAGAEAVAPAAGRYVLVVSTLSVPQQYCFSVGVNAEAPKLGPLGTACAVEAPTAAVAPFPHDDAGTGIDAPASLVPRIRLERDVVYHGQLTGAWPDDFLVDLDLQDTYAFDAETGDAIIVWVLAPQILYGLYAPDGTLLESDVTTGYVRMLGMETTAPQSGTYYLKFQGEPQGYCFAFDLNDHTPAASWLMLPGCTV
jgi:hypothetical protein